MLATIALAAALAAPQNDRPAIDALCAKIAKTTAKRDWKGLAALSTSDFHQKTLQGQTVTLKQLSAGLDQNLQALTSPKLSYKILTFKSDGKTANAEVYWSILGSAKDAHGKSHTVEDSDSEGDVFKKIKGHWLEASVTEHKDIQKIDGKEVPQAPADNGTQIG